MTSRLSEIQDILLFMKRQEATVYRTRTTSSASLPSTSVSLEQHAAWTPLIVGWMYKLCGVVELQPTSIGAAAYFLDTAVRKGLVSPADYQLVALTSLYIAMKLYEHKVFPLNDLLALVRDQGNHVTRDDVTAMERRMLAAFEYRMHPPTAHCWLQMYIEVVVTLQAQNNSDDESLESIRSDLEMTANYFIQDVIIAGKTECPPSVVAYAALLVALEEYINDMEAPMDSTPSPRSSMTNIQQPEPATDLQRSFVATMFAMMHLGSNTPGIFELLAEMSNSNSAASACLVHAQRAEKRNMLGVTSSPNDSPRHVSYV